MKNYRRRPDYPFEQMAVHDRQNRKTKTQHRRKSGAERYNDSVKQIEYRRSLRQEQEKRYEEKKAQHAESINRGIVSTDALSAPLKDENNPYLIAEKESHKELKKRIRLRKCAFILICFAASLGLNFVNIRLPLTPTFVSIEFTALPELLVALCVNPLAAIAVLIAKNGIYYLLNPVSFASLPNKVILNGIFIILTYALNRLFLNSKLLKNKIRKREQLDLPPKNYEGITAVTGGIISGVVTSVLSVFSFRYTIIPLLIKQTGSGSYEAEILKNYKHAFQLLVMRLPFIARLLPEIQTLTSGLIVYNIPLIALKYFICVVLAAAIAPSVKSALEKE